MSQQIDLAKVQATVDAMRERGKPNMELPGAAGTLARLQDAVITELTLWRTREINRETHPADRAEAIVTLFAGTMATEIGQLATDVDARFELANEAIDGFAKALGSIIANPVAYAHGVQRVQSEEVGNA